MYTHFRDAFAYGLRIPQVTGLDVANAGNDAHLCILVTQLQQPVAEDLSLVDYVYLPIVAYELQDSVVDIFLSLPALLLLRQVKPKGNWLSGRDALRLRMVPGQARHGTSESV